MAQLKVGGRAFDAPVIKLKRGSEEQALSAMTRDGKNDVAFKIGEDTFVAAGKDLQVKGLKAWDVVDFGGKAGHVVEVDKELFAAKTIGLCALIGAGVGLVGMLGVGALFGSMWGMPTIAEFAMMGGTGMGLFGAIGAGWAAMTRWWNGKQAARDVLGKYAA